MNKKMSKRQKDIKSKLMAAICMLLVSSIMMVSTTYAWFTLSTAPEVTGISTAVGANGNLEMALLPVNGNNIAQASDFGITTGTNDSMASQTADKANVTWGNLVDLTNYYGLENITLYPSAVNASAYVKAEDGTTDTIVPANIVADGSILKTPTYGTDGRMSALNANTIAGIYNAQQGKAFAEVVVGSSPVTNPAGVRLIGTSSGMSDRQLDFRNALSAASSAATLAQTEARGALEDNGGGLGNIAVKYATGSSTYDDTDKAALVAMVTDAKVAQDHIETGIRQYIYAYQISVNANYLTVRDQILGNATADPAVAASSFEDLASLIPAGMNDMIDALADSRAAITDAEGKLAALTGGSYDWSALSGAMSSLVNIEKMKINGTNVYDEVTGTITAGLKNKIMDDFLNNKGITLTMPSGSGVFADVSDFTGDYGAMIGVPASAVIQGSTSTITATMAAEAKDPTWFTTAKNIASEKTIEGEEGASQALTDFYGYVIDLAFKTNASGSKLQLQTEAVDRYSDDSTDEATMGHGATMIFSSNDTENGFQQPEMIKLMKHIRVVFFDPTKNNEVLGFGVPAGNVEPLGSGEVSVGLKFATSPLATQDAEGNDVYQLVENNVIMDLEQNKAHRLSVLVYLDGNSVTNADVAVGAKTSMTGRLNLQFSSNADLEPMKYTDFDNGTGGGNDEPEVTTIDPSVLIDQTITDLTTDSVSKVAVTDGGIAFTVDGYDASKHTVTVTVNDTVNVPVTYVEDKGFAGATTETVESVKIVISPVTGG